MAKVKYDYTDVDENKSGYNGDEPTPGVYPARVTECTTGTSKSSSNPMITVVVEITKGEFKGWHGWIYLVQTEEAAWKTKEFTDAIGLTKPGKKKGTWDTEQAVGKKCRIKTKREMYEGEARGKVKSVLPAKDAADSDSGGKDDKGSDEEPF
jgi:hypothetical protein